MSLLFEFSLEPIVTYCVLIDGLNKIFELCSFLFGGKQKFAFEKTHTLTMCTCICMYMVYINKHAFVPRVVYWTDKFRQYNKAYLALRSRPLILFPSKRTWGFLKFFFFSDLWLAEYKMCMRYFLITETKECSEMMGTCYIEGEANSKNPYAQIWTTD